MLRKLKNLYHLLKALFAVFYFRYPAKNLTVIGVTGTDGKTTTANLIYAILQEGGLPAATISSVSAKIGKEEIDTGFHVTTPNSWSLQKLLRQMADKNIRYVVLEATSHGLDQHRLLGCNFMMGVVTNITHEHLDYHKTYENYLAAKAKLFKGVKMAVLNRDDKSYQYLNVQMFKCVTYGIKNKADFTPESFQFKTKLPGEYNQYNCLAAIAAAKNLGVDEKIIKKALADFSGVVGRLERIDGNRDFQVLVDFAHTPNALEQALTQLRKELPLDSARGENKLILVFGCAGLRDREKRPMMGRIAAKYADFVILTAEDPRTEDVNKIIDEISQGCLAGGAKEIKYTTYYIPHTTYRYFVRIPDRQEAINFAIQKLAKKGDIVVICGKGHEKSMCYGKTEYPWSDQETARKALQNKIRSKDKLLTNFP